jgi:ankyrin repeat protein
LKAAGKGDENEVLRLIRAGTNLDAINEDGQSALTMAISRQHTNIVRVLVDNGATMDRSGPLVHKPLHIAIGTGNVELVRYLLDKEADIDETTAIGSPLTVAIKAGQESIVRLLLSRHADPNIVGMGNYSSLFYAIMSRKEVFIPLLLKYGAEAHNLPPTATSIMRVLSPVGQKLLQDWATQTYHERVKTLRRISSG